MIVVDASVIVLALGDDGPAGDAARDRLSGERMAAPELLDVEVVSAWRRHAAAGLLDARRSSLALADLRDLRVERVSHRRLMERCWELRANITAYDAAYVALAEALSVILLTADVKLASAPGIGCRTEILRVPE